MSPTEAARTIGSAYSLSSGQMACLEAAFVKDPTATGPLATAAPVSDADLSLLGRIESACIPATTLADAIVGGAARSGSSLPPVQRTCLDGAVGSLSEADRATLLAGLAISSALDDLQRAALGKIANGLLRTCRITPDATTASTGVATAPASPR